MDEALKQQGEIRQLRDRIVQLESALYLALDALSFQPGDWNQESIERHLREQNERARNHLEKLFDEEAREGLAARFSDMANRPGGEG